MNEKIKKRYKEKFGRNKKFIISIHTQTRN